MIKLDYKGSNTYLVQQTTPPVVYLDHWAFMNIAHDHKMSDVFVNLIKQKGGTLAVSYMNLLEFALVTDDKQIELTESFLNKLSPENIGFIEVNPAVVIDREDEILSAGKYKVPHQDNELLKDFIGRKHSELNPYSFNGFLKILRQLELREKNDKFMEGSDLLLKALRLKDKNDKTYQKQLRALPKGQLIQHATRYIGDDMFRQIIKDGNKQMGNNDWKDFLHSIVPISYCDIILLDKVWAQKAEITIAKLKKCGLINQNPCIYSARTMDKFWEKLKTW